MTIECIGLLMGFFIGTGDDGSCFYGKRDPVTKEVVEMYLFEEELATEDDFFTIELD